MKKWLIAFVIDVYLIPICFIGNIERKIPIVFCIIFLILSVILAIINILFAKKMYNNIYDKKRISFGTILVFKVLLVPFFIILFIYCFLVNSALWAVPGLFFIMSIWLLPLMIAYAYLLLYATSIYSIKNIENLKQQGIFTDEAAREHIKRLKSFYSNLPESFKLNQLEKNNFKKINEDQ
jgi:ABC-type multidrug transport system fused ATPase/permease subunit